jgi:hypothetical protein
MSPVHWITPSPTALSPAPTANLMTHANGSGERSIADMPPSSATRKGVGEAYFRLGAVATRVGKKAKKRRGKATVKRPKNSEVAPVLSMGLTGSQDLDRKEAELNAWDAAQNLAKQVLAQDAEIQALRRQVAELRRANISEEATADVHQPPAASGKVSSREQNRLEVRANGPAL